MTTIRIRKDGPYVIEGADVRIVDWDGVEQPCARMPVALCRCGASATKPFCDGSHRVVRAEAGDTPEASSR